MSYFFFGGIFCVVIGGLIVGILFFKKFSHLRVLDLDTSQALREKKLRNRIMESRMQRTMESQIAGGVRIVLVPWRTVQTLFRKAAGKLLAIERRYHRERARGVDISAKDLQAMVSEAERALREERFQVAEERLVEAISADPKFAQAYEALSRVYAAKREWKEAVESLMYYVKLTPKDGEGHFLLGALYERRGDREKAFTEYTRAIDLAPRNPKYLDAYIVLALAMEKYTDAEKMIHILREVNPDNAKISLFTEQLMPDKEADEVPSSVPQKRKKK